MNKYTKTKVDVKKVIKLYLSGMTQAEVGQEMGLSQKVIFHRLREAGVKCRVALKRDQRCELNDNWKGNKATYAAFHYRMKALKGNPQKCEACGTSDSTKTYDWASMTKQYHDPNDYKRLCRSCHWKLHKRHLNFKGGGKNV